MRIVRTWASVLYVKYYYQQVFANVIVLDMDICSAAEIWFGQDLMQNLRMLN
jgi:hypothetical protein